MVERPAIVAHRRLQQAPAPPAGERVAYIDGLRAVAILMVVFYHAWVHLRFGLNVHLENSRAARGLGFMAQRGYLGVNLFFVISGFSLAHASLRRRQRGATEWFRPSDYFARRCLRILPPYYVALIVALLLDALAVRTGHAFADQPRMPGGTDILYHLLLLHNLTRFTFSINGSFWTLGLEWQWYFLFPLALYLCIRSPRLALGATLAISLAWAHLAPGTHLQFASFPRLFEFCCGILVARSSVEARGVGLHLLIPGLLAPLILAELAYAPWFPHLLGLGTDTGLGQSLYGMSFACLLLLAARLRWLARLLSLAPLVGLGMASYSIYLIHEPLIEIVDLALARHQPVAIPLGMGLGIGAGLVFYRVVERPLTGTALLGRLLPDLRRLFGWADLLWWRARPQRLVLHIQGGRT